MVEPVRARIPCITSEGPDGRRFLARLRPPCSMYFLYTSATIVLFVALAPYFVYQALRYRKYVINLRQRLGYLPVSFNVDGEESIWIHAVSVGETLTARALAADLQAALPGAPPLRVDDDDRRPAGGLARHAGRRRGLLLSVRPAAHRQAHAPPGEAAPVHHDGNRDLAEPAARLPPGRREDGDGERPDLDALVPALPAGPAAVSRASWPTSIGSACSARESARPAHRPRRRPVPRDGDRAT